MSSLSRHELKRLQALRQRIRENLPKLENYILLTTETPIPQTIVHGNPRTPHRRGGILNISANDFKLLVSAGVVSPKARVEHSRGSYYAGWLSADLEHFTGYDDGTN